MTKQFIITEQIRLSSSCIYIIRQEGSAWLAKTNNTASHFEESYRVAQHPDWNFNNKLKNLNESILKYSQRHSLKHNQPELFYRNDYWKIPDIFALKTKDITYNKTDEIISFSRDHKKSIVFYGNLFQEGYSEEELFIIFAHEFGHCTEDLWESSPLCTKNYETKEHRADYFSGFFCRMAGVNITQENIDNLFYRGNQRSEHPPCQEREQMFNRGWKDYAVYHGSQISDL